MKPSAFIDSHPTQAFSCTMSQFEKYEANSIDGVLYIIGTKTKEGRKPFLVEKIDRTNLLNSLLSLYECLTPGMVGHVQELITEQDIHFICQWCKEYGTPMEDDTFNADSLWMKHRKVGFSISAFYGRLHSLYSCYLLWRKLYLGDIDKRNFYVAQNVPLKQCREFLQVHMLTLNIRFAPTFESEPPSFHLLCPDMLEIAKAQMYFECMSTDGYSVGVCAVCGSPFPKTRKNNTLCEACQRTKYQRTRERQRMVANRKNKTKEE